jgi:4-carboxymuconolactone decarboxylase
MSTQEAGRKRIKEILGENGSHAVEKLAKISPDFANYILTFAYADLYNRKNLSDKSRELIAVSSLISQKVEGLPLEARYDERWMASK